MRARDFLALALSACGDEPAGEPDSILGAPFTPRYTCAQTRAVENQGPSLGQELSSDGTKLLLARLEGEPWSNTASLVVSTVSSSGESDREMVAIASQVGELSYGTFRTTAEGWALVYARSGTLRLARFDGAAVSDSALGSVPVPPNAYSYQLVPSGAGGWFLAWRDGENGASLLVIDPSGTAGEMRTLIDPSGFGLAFSLSSGGVAWSAGEGEDFERELFFATVDDDGTVGTRRLIRAHHGWSLTFAGAAPNLMAIPDGFLLSWAESSLFTLDGDPVGFDEIEDLGDPRTLAARTVIMIAHLDASGEPMNPARLLSAGANDVEQAQPELFDFRGDLGLVWSEGSVIYNCAGCVPDHDLRLLILDRSSLDPLTDVLTLPWDDRGGLLTHSTGVVGSELGIASHIAYHTSADRALAFARCE